MSIKNTKNLDGKRVYEIAFLLKDPASEKAVRDLLDQNKVAVLNRSAINPLKLAYPIKKHSSAYFGYINFESEPESAKAISEALRFNQEVLRFLIVIVPPVKQDQKKSDSKKSEKPEVTETPKTALSNEALEETLEQILK